MLGLAQKLPTEDEKRAAILGLERLSGGITALQMLHGSLVKRLSNHEARTRLAIGKQSEMLVRRAELADVIAFVQRAHNDTARAAQAHVEANPLVFLPKPVNGAHAEAPSVADPEC